MKEPRSSGIGSSPEVEGPPAAGRGGKWLRFALKGTVSAAAIWFLVRNVDVGEAAATLAGSRKPLWAAALFLMILSQLLSTVRWKILLEPLGFALPWIRVVSIYFIGMFFSLFLPTVVGGDGIKTFYVARDWKRVPAALYSLLADRTIGLAAMLLYGAVGAGLLQRSLPPLLVRSILASVAAVYLVLILLPRLSTPGLILLRRVKDVPEERLFVYWHRPSSAVRAWCLSLAVHFCVVAAHIAMGRALGLAVPPAAWLVVYPVTALAAFLPVSLNGIGLREAAYLYMLGLFGVSREMALSLGLMYFSVVVVNGLLGGLPYLFGDRLRTERLHAA